jgi:nitrogen fixation protein FixH
LTPQILEKKSVLIYEVKDKSGNAVDNAKIEVLMTRPDTVKLDLNLSNPTIIEGKYTFNAIDLPKPGRWDIMAKITVGENQRYYSLKADTRYPNTIEF